MKEQYGNMLVCTDQGRFTTKENELLAQLHTEKSREKGSVWAQNIWQRCICFPCVNR